MEIINITKEMINNTLQDGQYYKNGEIIDKEYSLDELCLVRATDIFPSDNCIKSLTNANALLKTPSIIFKEALSDNPLKDSCKILYEGYRTTIHFSINGMVGNHMYGNFSNRNFIIIEPFINHITDNLISLRSEDTYFKDCVFLSNKASMIISRKKLDEIKNDIEYQDFLFKHKIFIYDFSEDEIKNMFAKYDNENCRMLFEQRLVNCVLEQLGYPHFTIGNHGYIDNNQSVEYMNRFIDNLRKKMNFGCERHFNSSIHLNDSELNQLNLKKSDINFYRYVLNHYGINDGPLYSYIKFFEYNGNYESFEYASILFDDAGNIILKEDIIEKIKNFVTEIGIEKIILLTEQYNESLKKEEQMVK